MNYKLWIVAGALSASVPVLAQNAAPHSTPPDDFKILDHEIGVSGDFLYGNGYVQLPIGEALFRGTELRENIGIGKFTTADRKSALYYGGTLSGSIGKTWYLDVSYSRGTTEGSLQDLNVFGLSSDSVKSDYKLSDQYYQMYGKYAFPQFSGTRFAAYLRLGATYSENSASVTYEYLGFKGGFESTSNDYLGNIGLGGEYYVYRGDSFKVTTVIEGEGFGGLRTSSIQEKIDLGVIYSAAMDQDSLVYGGLGRGVLRLVKTLGQEGRWKLNVDVGFQGKYLINEYDSMANSITRKELREDPESDSRQNVHGNELLWGPYGRVGLSYSF